MVLSRMERPAYLLLGHGELIESKATKTVPGGFTIVTGGKCGHLTYGKFGRYTHQKSGLFSLINSEDESINPTFLQNPDTLGKRLLAKKLGPVLVENAGTKFIDANFYPVIMDKMPDGSINIKTAGVLMTPFTGDKVSSYTFGPDTLLKDINLRYFYNSVVFPSYTNVHAILIKTLLHRDKEEYKLEEYDFLSPSIGEIFEYPGIPALFKHIFSKITISTFYNRYYPLFEKLIVIKLSDLLTLLPTPGVVYSLSCRVLKKKEKAAENNEYWLSTNSNSNNSLSEVNKQRKKNLIRRQIEEAELGRKSFVKVKYNMTREVGIMPPANNAHPVPTAPFENNNNHPAPSAPPYNLLGGRRRRHTKRRRAALKLYT